MTCSVVLRRMAISRFFAPLHDERDDAHLLGREPVADPGAHHISSGESATISCGGLPGVAGSHRAHALRQGRAGDIAEDHAAKALLQVGAGGLVVLAITDAAAVGGLQQRTQPDHIRRSEAANSTIERETW